MHSDKVIHLKRILHDIRRRHWQPLDNTQLKKQTFSSRNFSDTFVCSLRSMATTAVDSPLATSARRAMLAYTESHGITRCIIILAFVQMKLDQNIECLWRWPSPGGPCWPNTKSHGNETWDRLPTTLDLRLSVCIKSHRNESAYNAGPDISLPTTITAEDTKTSATQYGFLWWIDGFGLKIIARERNHMTIWFCSYSSSIHVQLDTSRRKLAGI